MKPLAQLVRPNILALQPYSTARDEYAGGGIGVWLDANENPYDNGVNRYPDPHQKLLKQKIAALKGVREEQVFIGPWSPESAGDYASGTNHTLPTGGWARAYSGVNTDSFLRKITYQELSRKGLATLSPTVIAMAEAEGLGAHAAAVRVRMKGGVL